MRKDQHHIVSTSTIQHADAVLHDDLRVALSRHEFFVAYQPVVDIASNVVMSREALVRWRHPTKGVVMPGTFIETAERTGIILDITNEVLEQVCRMLKAERQTRPKVPVSVNLSAVCLTTGGVPDSIRSMLKRFDVLPDQLILEVTETATLGQSDQVMAQFEELHAMGIEVVMDDFGTGYSSLANLWRYPVSGVKVDRSLSADIPYDERMCAIVAATIEIARKLGLSIVIEGVESERQANWIRQFPNVLAQGYLFGRAEPLP
nr:EAL domain-containing protein [Burkholderia pyrrocinia]